jgi:chromate transporter
MLRLGTLAFGGPVAHLAHFQRELIDKRKWLPNDDYADLIAFCQFLPGPASSQVGMGLGLIRAGLPGMFAAWFAFSLPSVVILLAAALGMGAAVGWSSGWLHGLMAGVVAIVADAILKMAKKLCPTAAHLSLALGAAVIMLLAPGTLSQMLVILVGAAAGITFIPPPSRSKIAGHDPKISRATMGIGWAILLLLVVAPLLASSSLGSEQPTLLNVYASFAQTGALVFGGGHVVLPMLQAEVVGPGWMTSEEFLLYGAAAFAGIFMPSFGFMAALFPLWHQLRTSHRARRALAGINAAVVGLLIAALYDPVWTKAMNTEAPHLSVAIILGAWLLLVPWKRPAWLVVIASAAAGSLLGV